MRLSTTILLLLICLGCLTAQTATIRLNHTVYFTSASHEPAPAEVEQLSAFTDQLTSYAGYTLTVEAFTDELGSTDYNEALARRRAEAIATILSQRQVAAVTTKVLAYGEGQARQNTTDDAERRTDRRVDLIATVTKWTDADAAISAARELQRQTTMIDDPTIRQTVFGDQGGVFVIDPNSLVDADGQTATGPVTIELVEAYDFSDMLIAGLTTTSGGRTLETGGMINLTATDAAGRELQLKKGAKLASSIPTRNYNDQMQLFVGAGHDAVGTPTDWTLTNGGLQPSASNLILPPLNSRTYEEFKEGVRTQVDNLVRFCGDGSPCDYRPDILSHKAGVRYLNWMKANPKLNAPSYQNPATYRLRKKPAPIDTSGIAYEPRGSEKLFMSAKRKATLTRQRRKQAQTRFDRQQKHYDNSVTYRNNLPVLNEQKRLDFESASATYQVELERQKELVMSQVSREMFAISEARRQAYEKYRNMKIKALEESLVNADDLTGQESGLQRYFFNLTELGWANCDMFSAQEDPVEVLASLPESSPAAKVMLLPTNRRSVISYNYSEAGTWRNVGIPNNTGYQVIAYEVREGQLVLAHKQVDAARANHVEALEYQPVAVAELRAKLAELVGS